jgi:uncharacterized protein (TIGR03435 family)
MMCLSRNVAGGVLMALLASSWATHSRGQEPAGDTAVFEVASIRPNVDPSVQLGVRPVTSNRFSAVATVKMLVQMAYGFPNTLFDGQVVGGPGWASSDRFEIDAVFSGSISATPGGPPVRLFAMMRALLVDRFKLQVRREQRQLAIYDLVLDRPTGALGSRLTRSDGTCLPITSATGPITDFGPFCGFKRVAPGVISAKGGTLESLAGALAFLPDVQRVVRDRTGLSGQFDFDLEYTVGTGGDAQAGPSVFTALKEQLGLALRPATGPVDVLVIDNVAPPTPN